MTRWHVFAALVTHRLSHLLMSPWLIGAVAVFTVSFGALIATSARGLDAHTNRYKVETQQRLRHTVQHYGPGGRSVDLGLRILRRPSRAAVVIAGQDPSLPAAWDLGPGSIESLPPYSTVSQTTGPTNAAAFLGQFGGLLALVIGLFTVVNDRQRGWTDAARAASASVGKFLLADMLALCLTLAFVAGIWTAAAWLVLDHTVISEWADASGTFMLFVPPTWMYLVAFYGYGTAIGWSVRGALKASTWAIALWVGIVLIGPQVFSSYGALGSKSRARAEHERRDAHAAQTRQIEDRLGERLETPMRNKWKTLYAQQLAEEAFKSVEGDWLREFSELRAVTNKAEDEWRSEWSARTSRIQRAARVMPSTLLSQALAEVAGTGNLTTARWEEAVVQHKRRLDALVFDNRATANLWRYEDGKPENWGLRRKKLIPYREVPQFVEPRVSLADRWHAARVDVLVLALHALFALGLAAFAQRRAWRRYDFVSSSSPDTGKP